MTVVWHCWQSSLVHQQELRSWKDYLNVLCEGNKAVQKKKSVSCPAGGQNCGQSGGRMFFLLFRQFYF